MKNWFHRTVLERRWLAFAVMGLSFFGFGVGTLNLFMLLKANAELFAGYGWQAVLDGGLQQLVELLLTGYLSMICYLVFKVCEHSLVRRLSDARPAETDADPAFERDRRR
jgi:hypothetical protein